MEHITIYREPGRYAGWPANYGIWAWGDEIVVGFTAGYHDPDGGFHAHDRNRPFVAMQARSLDGGRSWDVGRPPAARPAAAASRPMSMCNLSCGRWRPSSRGCLTRPSLPRRLWISPIPISP